MSILKELLALKEEDESVVDLQTFKGNSIPHSAWTDGVMYRDMNVYQTVYEGRGEKDIARMIERVIESFNGDLDVQEVYLGYSPSKDQFIQGYDGWFTIESDGGYGDEDEDSDPEEERGNCSPYVIFGLSDEGKVVHVESESDISGREKMWYGKGGGHDAVRKRFPDLIDIRLD